MKTIHINLIRLTQVTVFFILLLYYSNPKSQPASNISNAPNLFCGMESGIYYYKIMANSNSKAGNYVSIKKMILLK